MLWYRISAQQNKNIIFHLDLNHLLPESIWQTLYSSTLHRDGADRNTDSAILLSPCAISLRDTVKCRGHKSCVFTTCAVVSYLLGCPALPPFLLLLFFLILSVQRLGAFNTVVTWDIRGWCFSISRLCHRLRSEGGLSWKIWHKGWNLTLVISDSFVRGFVVFLLCACFVMIACISAQ